jgi:hypothetical protein
METAMRDASIEARRPPLDCHPGGLEYSIDGNVTARGFHPDVIRRGWDQVKRMLGTPAERHEVRMYKGHSQTGHLLLP